MFKKKQHQIAFSDLPFEHPGDVAQSAFSKKLVLTTQFGF